MELGDPEETKLEYDPEFDQITVSNHYFDHWADFTIDQLKEILKDHYVISKKGDKPIHITETNQDEKIKMDDLLKKQKECNNIYFEILHIHYGWIKIEENSTFKKIQSKTGSIITLHNNPIVKELLFSEKKSSIVIDETIPIFKSILDDAFGIEGLVQL